MTLRSGATKGGSPNPAPTAQWFTYIVECADGSFYVGITDNLQRRVSMHNSGAGAAWTARRRPVYLRYAETHPDKRSARKREIEIKGWRREKKFALFNTSQNLIRG